LWPLTPFTKLNKVFTYSIVAMWGSRFTHHGMAVDNGGGWQHQGGSVGFRRCRRQALVFLGEDEGTKGDGGIRRSFLNGRFSTGGSTPVRWQASHGG
jgi:hypothetical protein